MTKYFSVSLKVALLLLVNGVSLEVLGADRCPTSFTQDSDLYDGQDFVPAVAMVAHDLPSEFSSNFNVLIETEGGETLIASASRTIQGGVRFVVPEVPGNARGGGNVNLTLIDGNLSCAQQLVAFQGLEPVEGVFDEFAGLLEERFRLKVEMAGGDFDVLMQSEVGAQTPYLAWLQYLYWSFNGRGNSNSAISVLNKLRAQGAAQTKEAISRVESYLIYSGALAQMAAGLDEEFVAREQWGGEPLFQSLPTSEPLTWHQRLPWNQHIHLAQHKPSSNGRWVNGNKTSIRHRLDGKAVVESYGYFKISTPEKLAARLEEQLDSQSSLKPHVQIYRDLSGAVLGAGQTFFEATPGGKGLAVAFNATGQGLFAWTILDKIQDGLYPYSIKNTKIEVSRKNLYTHKEPSSGRVTAVRVTPVARGVDLGKLLADVALQLTPVSKLLDKRGGSLAKVGKKMADKGMYITNAKHLELMKQFKPNEYKQVMLARNADTLLSAPLDVNKALYGGMAIDKAPKLFVIAPFDYPDVNILKKGYVSFKVNGSRLVELGFIENGQASYSAKDRGVAQIQAWPTANKFIGQYEQKDLIGSVQINVDQEPRIVIRPALRKVLPGDVVSFTVEVESLDRSNEDYAINTQIQNSSHKIFRKTGPHKATSSTLSSADKLKTWALDIKTSNNSGDYPAKLAVERSANPLHFSRARIETATISPRTTCVELSSQVGFSVEDEAGNPFKDLVWSVFEGLGSINSNGVYTAPSKSKKNQSVTISVQAQGRPNTKLFTTFQINCGCYWSFTASGLSRSGQDIQAYSNPSQIVRDGETSHMILTGNDEGHYSGVTITSHKALSSGSSSGTLIASIGDTSYATACVDEQGICADETLAPPAYHLKIVGGGFIQGELSGRARYVDQFTNGPAPIVPIKFSFRAALVKHKGWSAGVGSIPSMIDSFTDNAEVGLDAFAHMQTLLGKSQCNIDMGN